MHKYVKTVGAIAYDDTDPTGVLPIPDLATGIAIQAVTTGSYDDEVAVQLSANGTDFETVGAVFNADDYRVIDTALATHIRFDPTGGGSQGDITFYVVFGLQE